MTIQRDSVQPDHAQRVEELYAEHFPFVWRILRRLGVPRDAIDDAVQEVFLVVHRRISDFEGRSSDRTWLFGIARRVASRARERARSRSEPLTDSFVDDTSQPPDRVVADAEETRVLYALLDELDESKREIFVLAELEQMTAASIGHLLGLNPNTVFSRLRAARKDFEKAVTRYRARAGRRA